MVLAVEAPPTPITTPNDIVNLIEKVAGWLFAIILALAVVFLLIAAFLYLTALGDQTKIGKAKTILSYAIWALVIAVIAGGVSVFIQNFIT